MSKKIKIYLDTSVISCLQAHETPERMADSLRLWEDLKYPPQNKQSLPKKPQPPKNQQKTKNPKNSNSKICVNWLLI